MIQVTVSLPVYLSYTRLANIRFYLPCFSDIITIYKNENDPRAHVSSAISNLRLLSEDTLSFYKTNYISPRLYIHTVYTKRKSSKQLTINRFLSSVQIGYSRKLVVIDYIGLSVCIYVSLSELMALTVCVKVRGNYSDCSREGLQTAGGLC